MVVSEQQVASEVGADILKAGGNAIDAAVAVGYALAVVNPCCGNIGGGGFMTIHLQNGENVFLNFRERAPLAASKDMYLDKTGRVIPGKSTYGYLAVATPGTVLGLDTALQRYGTMTRRQVMAPAIRLAQDGYRVTATDAWQFAKYADAFKKSPNVAAIFLKNGKPYQAGDLLIQKNLAHTLDQIANEGADAFYKGSIAEKIVAASSAHGGILSLQDFADYTVQELKPIKCHYRGYTIVSAPPPSSGGVTLCEALNILENFPLSSFNSRSITANRYIIEAMRHAFHDRNHTLGDPDFINNPISQLLSSDYARNISDMIDTNRRAPLAETSISQHELTDTTHFSIVDHFGNAVAMTYTINGFFGAKVIAGDTGFFLNDEMDDLSASPGHVNQFNLMEGENNAIAPGKRPLSSMTPTIVLKDNKPYLVLGSPGGPRIITSVLLTLINVIDFGMPLQAAVDAPRFHFQAYPDEVYMEPFAFSFFTNKGLEYLGYHLTPQGSWSAVEAIEIDPVTGEFTGANDVRREAGGVR